MVEESDPKPRFARYIYAGYVTENTPPPVEIIDLTTSDEQRGRAVRYEIVEGNKGRPIHSLKNMNKWTANEKCLIEQK